MERPSRWWNEVRWDVAGPITVSLALFLCSWVALQALVVPDAEHLRMRQATLIFLGTAGAIWSLPRWIAMWCLGPVFFGKKHLALWNSIAELVWSLPTWLLFLMENGAGATSIEVKVLMWLAMIVIGWCMTMRGPEAPPQGGLEHLTTTRGAFGIVAAVIFVMQVAFVYGIADGGLGALN